MKKIIFYTKSPLNSAYAKKILIDKIIKEYDAELWTTFNKNNIYFKNSKDYSFKNINYYLIKNNFSLYKKLKEIKNYKPIFFYLDYNASLDFVFLFLLKLFNYNLIIPPRRTAFKFDKFENNFFNKFKDKNFNKFFLIFLKLIKTKLFLLINYLNLIKRPNIIFVCGSEGKIFWSKYKPDKFITTYSVDLSYKKSPQITKDYAVFIDESKNYSPDLSIEKEKDAKTVLNINNYYQNLRNFFDLFEKTNSLKILISCSNKYDYKNKSPFGKREVYYGMTNELIMNSKLILCHSSSGFWQGIYNKKKIVFLTDINLQLYNQNYVIKNNAKFLDTITLDLLNKNYQINMKINHDRYDDILSKYFLSKNNLTYDNVIFNVIENIN